jgi:hypothetical protein
MLSTASHKKRLEEKVSGKMVDTGAGLSKVLTENDLATILSLA